MVAEELSDCESALPAGLQVKAEKIIPYRHWHPADKYDSQ
jgi:hypothetical protein